MNEPSTESLDEAPPPTAHEAARTYEESYRNTSDDSVRGTAPDDSAPIRTSLDGTSPNAVGALPDNPVPNGTATPSDSTVSSGTTAKLDSLLPSGTSVAPDNSLSDENAPDSALPHEDTPPNEHTSDWGASQPGALPPPHMHLHLQNNLRLRMKVWTDPKTLKRYLMPMGFMRDLVNGQPVSDVMYAYAMRDDDTKLVVLTALEWNLLPFFYFREDGPAPRTAARTADSLP